jgi:hypothetical protein
VSLWRYKKQSPEILRGFRLEAVQPLINHGREKAVMNECMVEISGIRFENRPRIDNRRDAVKLLEAMIQATFFENVDQALEALKDAIEKEII